VIEYTRPSIFVLEIPLKLMPISNELFENAIH